MSYQIREVSEDVDELVDLATVKAYCRIDADYTSDDADLSVLITAARIRLEQYLNIGLAYRQIELQWNGIQMEMPLSPTGTIVSVKDGDTALTTDDYTLSSQMAKTIHINSVGCFSGASYWYGIGGEVEVTFPANYEPEKIYKAIYNTGYETLPATLKQAVLAEIDHLFKLRGMPVTDLISPNASLLASGYSRNLVL